MGKNVAVWLVVVAASAGLFACALSQEENAALSGRDGAVKHATIVGAWKLSSVHCDADGNNCEWYTGTLIFRYAKNGELIVNDVKRGTYRMLNGACLLDTGEKTYTVNIIHIDSSRLITGENHRNSTEIYKRIE
ncbi:MAG: hypothetical protein JW807_07560 [Spirochaetes bacterium]|nr:hypothetical protein [Spirochaetota bacterium]